MKLPFFKKKGTLAQLNTVLMIALSTTNPNTIPVLKFVMQQWNRYASTSQLNSLQYAGGYTDKNQKLIFYFSPYTFDCFLKYLRKLIDGRNGKGTSIPHTNGTKLSKLSVGTSIVENDPLKNKGQIVTNKNGQMYVKRVNIRRTYSNPPVTYTDHDDYASFIIYNLLFFSYSTTALHNLDNPKATYQSNKAIAKQFKLSYQSEYKFNHHHDIPKGSFAHMPNYRDFINGNQDSVFIPNLTTKKQRKQSKAYHRNYNMNIFDMDTDKADDAKSLQNAEKYKQMHYRNRLVTSMESKRQEQAQENEEEQAEQSQAIQEKREKEAQAWRESVANVAQQANDNKAMQIKGSQIDNAKTSAQTEASPSASSNNKSGNTVSSNPVIRAKEQAKALQQSNQVPKSAQNKAKAKSTNKKKVSSKSKSKTKAKVNNNTNKTQQQPKPQTQAPQKKQPKQQPIDPASMKSPYLITNDVGALKKAVTSIVKHKNANGLYKEVHFQRMHTRPLVPSTESPEVALKSGHLSNQRYVEEQTNDFKKMANTFINHYEYVLNLAEQRSELNMIDNAYDQMTKKIESVVNKYTSDKPLEDNAVSYYQDQYHQALLKLRRQCDSRLGKRKIALKKEFHAKFSVFQDKVYTWFDQQQRQIENDLKSEVLNTYSDNNDKRDAQLNKQIKQTKADARQLLSSKLQNHKISFKHKAADASKMLYDFFVRGLHKNKKKWIKTVQDMISAQVKKIHAQDKANKLALKVAQTKTGSSYNTELRNELKDVRQYSKDASKQYENERNRFLATRDKLYKQADHNNELQAKIDDLRNQIATSTSSAKQNVQIGHQEIKHLRKLISQKDNHEQKLTQSLVSLSQDKADYSTNLTDIKNQLSTNQMEVNEYKDMLHNQRSATYNQSQQLAALRQKYVTLHMAMNTNHISVSEADKRASMAQARTSASVAKSVADSFTKSIDDASEASNSALDSMKASLFADASKANHEAEIAKDSLKAQQQEDKRAKISQSASASKSASVARQSFRNSLVQSASIARHNAVERARQQASAEAQRRLEESNAIVNSQASVRASLSARAVGMSASARISQANSYKASVQAEQMYGLKSQAQKRSLAKKANQSAHQASLRASKAISLAESSANNRKAQSKAKRQASLASKASNQARIKQEAIQKSLTIANSKQASVNSKLASIKASASQASASAISAQQQQAKSLAQTQNKNSQVAQQKQIASYKASLSRKLENSAKASVAQAQKSMQASASLSQSRQASIQAQQASTVANNETQTVTNYSAINESTGYKPSGNALQAVQSLDAKNRLARRMAKTNAKEMKKRKKSHKSWFQW